MTLSCDFCVDFGAGEQGSRHRRRPAWVSSVLAVTPTVGPLAPGHVLILPHRHATSFGQLSGAECSELLAATAGIESLLARRFGGTIAFEHGTSGIPTAGGCGIDHAHMHFVPVASPLNDLPPVPNASWQRLDGDWYGQLREFAIRMTPYVYMRTVDGARFVTPVRSLPSQFVRRWVAEQLGVRGWNWKDSNPDADFAEATKWMTVEIPPPGFSAITELAEATR